LTGSINAVFERLNNIKENEQNNNYYGGAAGYFTAINAKENNPDLDITILEKGKRCFTKVRIEAEDNVTHACFTPPKELCESLPKRRKRIIGAFLSIL
jgi:predicted flavoprotein YhiN